MRLEMRQDAAEHEVYAPDAFASQIGKEIPLTFGIGGPVFTRGRLVAAEVADDGKSVLLTVDAPDPRPTADFQLPTGLSMSFAFRRD